MNDPFIKTLRAPNRARMDIFTKKNKSCSASIQEKKNCPCRFDLEKAEKHEGTQVPEIIFRITERLNRNLCTQSLYLKPGNKKKILKLRSKPGKIDFDRQNLHDLTSLLKMILSEMEAPLLPKQIFETFKRTADQSRIKKELQKLDPVRKETLEHVMKHILRVNGKRYINTINKGNICMIWGPIVYYPLVKRSDTEKREELFGILMDIYAEQVRIEQIQYFLNEIQPNKSPKKRKRSQRETPLKRKEKNSAGGVKESRQPKAEIIANEDTTEPTEELMAKENGDQVTEEKREEENSFAEGNNVHAEELKLKESGRHDTEEKREEENYFAEGNNVHAEELKSKESGGHDTEEKREEENYFAEGNNVHAEELKLKESGGHDTEEKREEENYFAEGSNVHAEELKLKESGDHDTQEKREEKGNDLTEDARN